MCGDVCSLAHRSSVRLSATSGGRGRTDTDGGRLEANQHATALQRPEQLHNAPRRRQTGN